MSVPTELARVLAASDRETAGAARSAHRNLLWCNPILQLRMSVGELQSGNPPGRTVSITLVFVRPTPAKRL